MYDGLEATPPVVPTVRLWRRDEDCLEASSLCENWRLSCSRSNSASGNARLWKID